MNARPTALVTGASRGIGRAVAIKLAETHDILAVARNAELLDALCRDVAATGGTCRPCVLDLTRPADIERELGGVAADVVVNNAGVITKKPLLRLTPDEWGEMMLTKRRDTDVFHDHHLVVLVSRQGHYVLLRVLMHSGS